MTNGRNPRSSCKNWKNCCRNRVSFWKSQRICPYEYIQLMWGHIVGLVVWNGPWINLNPKHHLYIIHQCHSQKHLVFGGKMVPCDGHVNQKTLTFFQVYGTNCSKQIKSLHISKKIHEMIKNVGFIMDPHMAKAPRLNLGMFWSPLNAWFRCYTQSNDLDFPSDWNVQTPSNIM